MNTQEKWQEIIDKINRVPKEFPVAALKGVQFEECVNQQLKGFKHKVNENGEVETKDFVFSKAMIDRVAKKLQNAKKQQEYIEGIIDTPMGPVKMYGFVDFSYPEMFVDLKTTGKYKPGKYAINNQHKAYPLIAQKNGRNISRFTYLVTDFDHMYIEPYEPNQSLYDELISDTVSFLEFLEENRSIITDKKIFGL